MSDYLDLDALVPEPKTVKLGGKTLEVNQPTLKQILKLQKAFSRLEKGQPAEDQVVDALSGIIPEIANDDVDLTIHQLEMLVNFVSKIATDGSGEAGKKHGPQKKTD